LSQDAVIFFHSLFYFFATWYGYQYVPFIKAAFLRKIACFCVFPRNFSQNLIFIGFPLDFAGDIKYYIDMIGN